MGNNGLVKLFIWLQCSGVWREENIHCVKPCRIEFFSIINKNKKSCKIYIFFCLKADETQVKKPFRTFNTKNYL